MLNQCCGDTGAFSDRRSRQDATGDPAPGILERRVRLCLISFMAAGARRDNIVTGSNDARGERVRLDGRQREMRSSA